MTPFDSESLSLKFGAARPIVGEPSADTSGGHAGFTEGRSSAEFAIAALQTAMELMRATRHHLAG
jgi:hypothetical protein